MGGSKTTQKTDNTLDPWSKQQYSDIAGQVKTTLDSNPYQAYSGNMVAPLDPMETQAADYFRSNMGAGQGMIGSAAETARSVGGYQPIMLDANRDSYMNPYINDVVDTTLADLERQRSMAINEGQAAATKAGAYGGSRHGVADSLTNEAALRTAASTSAGLRSAGFESASDRAMTAGLANQGADLSGAGMRLQGAGLLGDLGRTQSDLVSRDAFALAAFGEAARGIDQATLDAAYQEYLRGQEDPYRRSAALTGLLGATPMVQDSQTVQKKSPGFASILGTVFQGAGLLGA